MARKIGRVRARHWKQRFQPGARYIFRKRGNWYGVTYEVGARIPQELQDDYRRLRRAWDTRLIELEIFDPVHVNSGQPITIAGAIAKLDEDDPTLWLADGRARVDAIEALLGLGNVSAAQRDAVYAETQPDG